MPSRRILALASAAALALAVPPASAVVGAVPPVGTPVFAKNLDLIGSFPHAGAISTAFDPERPLMYVNTLDGVTVYDISTPEQPVPTGTVPLPHFENERMTIGHREDGTTFVLVGIDAAKVDPTDPGGTKVKAGTSLRHLVVVDVTDPAAPRLRGRTDTLTSTHTVSCIDAECTVAYTAGAYDNGTFSVIDLTDLDAPKDLGKRQTVNGSGHQWDFDDAGVVWQSGFGGIGAYDVSDPLNPVALNATNRDGVAGRSKYNSFILHNSFHPFAESFTQERGEDGRLDSGPASLEGGNVLLATEEDYDNPVCGGDAGEGTFSTWRIPYLDAAQFAADGGAPGTQGAGTIEPLDNWNTEILDSGFPTPAGAFCSAHYFTVNDAGFVAQSWYQQGTRILDVRDPSDIKQVGYFFTGAQESWISYWVPEYDENGQTGRYTDLIYTNDVVRGIDVLRFTAPDTAPAETLPVSAPVLPEWLGVKATTSAPLDVYGWICRTPDPAHHS